MLILPNKKEFEKLSNKQLTIRDLAKKYFVSEQTISKWATELGLNKRGDKFQKEMLKKLMDTNITKKALAKHLGCSVITLNTYLNKYGLQRVAK